MTFIVHQELAKWTTDFNVTNLVQPPFTSFQQDDGCTVQKGNKKSDKRHPGAHGPASHNDPCVSKVGPLSNIKTFSQ